MKVLEKQLKELQSTFQTLQLTTQRTGEDKLNSLKQEIIEGQEKTEREELYTLILNHVVERDKKNLLFEKEPIAKRKAKLAFLTN